MKDVQRNKVLDLLFEKWELEYQPYQNHLIKDGIINEDKFKKEKIKILFICKEPNNPMQDAGDFRTWWKGKVKYSFSMRIGTWAYGILNGFKPINEITRDDIIDSLSRISFLNLKKNGGKSTSSKNEIIEHTKQNLKYLKKQISIIDPNIIILGLSRWNELISLLFDENELKVIDDYIHAYGDKIIINFYHPTARGKGITNKFLYEKLKKMINILQNKDLLPKL